jgi:hemerythrin-like domain-containing protein
MADPIQVLMDEHRVIERVLGALEIASRAELPVDFYERAIDFIATFADAQHHGKEEERLFPALERKGMPREGGPIGVMCDEHVVGRGHVARMREMAAAGDLDGLRAESLEYAALLRQHIRKEDEVLFVMARQFLNEDEMGGLEKSFEEVPYRHEYVALADKLVEEAKAAAK